jgi:hypothetical protein
VSAGGRRDRAWDLGLSVVLGVVALGPFLLSRGFALRGDMVFVPRQPWKDAWLGWDGTTARFVPGDAVLSALTHLVPGDLVQKALLLGVFVLGGTGAGLLVRRHGHVARAAAIVVMCWNPWVAERLLIGQWGVVVGYAALPWVVLAAVRVRDAVAGGVPLLVCALAFTALWSPPSALLGVLAAGCVVVVRPRRSALAAVSGAAVLVNLPWLLPSLLAASRVDAAGASFEAFVARGESAAGLLPSVLSMGGIWKTSVVPDERTLVPVVLLSCVPVVAAAVGWRLRLAGSTAGSTAGERATGAGLALLAALSLLLALLPAVPPLTEALDSAAARLPALALLRDSHRFLGPAVLVLLPGVAALTDHLWARRPGAEAVRALAVLLAVWPALCLPSLAWGLRGAVEPVGYPDEWSVVADELATVDEGATVVLPWRGGYRGFAWNERRAMLDPAPRFFDGEVLIDDRLFVGDTVLANEDPRLADVTEALEDDDAAEALSRLGVSAVLVHRDNGVADADVPEGEVLHDGAELVLVGLGPPTGDPTYARPARWAVVAGDLVALLTVLVAVACIRRARVYGDVAHDDSGHNSGRGST